METEDKFRKKVMKRKLQIERIDKNKEWRDRKRTENGDLEHFVSDYGSKEMYRVDGQVIAEVFYLPVRHEPYTQDISV